MKFVARYITPEKFQGVAFDTKDEAIDTLRDYMVELVGDPEDVCIGVVLDHEIVSKIFNGDGYDVMKDADGNVVTYKSGLQAGRPRKVKLNSVVYTISSSDRENTEKVLKYEAGDFREDSKAKFECNEYLQ